MKVNMTAALTKTIFSPSVVTVFCLHTGCQHIAITKPYLCFPTASVIVYKRWLRAQLKSSKTLHVQTNHAATSFFFFPLKLRQLDGDTDVLFLQIK